MPRNFFTIILAIEFHQSQEYQDAIELFEKVANSDLNSEITQRLLICYYHEKKFDKALEISKNLRQKYGPLELITEIEIKIIENIGNLQLADELYKEFTLKFPGNRMALIRYAFLKYRLQKINEVKAIVTDFTKKFKLEELKEDEIIHTASLLNIIGKNHEAVKLIYNGLKKYPNKQEMHEKYCSLLLPEPKNEEAFQVEEVGIDTAVKIKDENDEIHWKIIENENPDASKSEISAEHPLGKEMFGKKVGDRILFKDSPIQPESGIDAAILFKAAQKARWSLEPPFTLACELLKGKHSDESSFQVAVDFWFKLWDEPSITIFLKNNLANFSLEELLKGRDRLPVFKKLNQLIAQKFLYHPFYLNEIKQTLKAWKDTHII